MYRDVPVYGCGSVTGGLVGVLEAALTSIVVEGDGEDGGKREEGGDGGPHDGGVGILNFHLLRQGIVCRVMRGG